MKTQDEMIAAGFMAPDEKFLLATLAEVEELTQRKIDFDVYRGILTDADAFALREAQKINFEDQTFQSDAFLKIRSAGPSSSGMNVFDRGASELASRGIIGKRNQDLLVSQVFGFVKALSKLSAIFLGFINTQEAFAQTGDDEDVDMGNIGVAGPCIYYKTPSFNLGNWVPDSQCWRSTLHDLLQWDVKSSLSCLVWWKRPFKIPTPTFEDPLDIFISNLFPTPVTLTSDMPEPWRIVMCVVQSGKVLYSDCCWCMFLKLCYRGAGVEFLTRPWGCYFDEVDPDTGDYRPQSAGAFDLIREGTTKLCGTDF